MRRGLFTFSLLSTALVCGAAIADKVKIAESFCGAKTCKYAMGPFGLAQDLEGNLYGATDGTNKGGQVVYELVGGKKYKLLYVLCPRKDCSSGNEPSGPLVVDTAGNLYGTRFYDGRPS